MSEEKEDYELCLIMPVYNEELCIELVISQWVNYLRENHIKFQNCL